MYRALTKSTALLTAVALIATLAVGCSSSKPPAERIIGEWSIDTEAVRAAVEAQVAAASEGTGLEAMGAQMMLAMIPALGAARFIFEEGGVARVRVMGQSESGSYEVVSSEGESVTIRVTKEDGEVEETTFTFDGNDRMSAQMDDMPLTFVRAD